MSLDLDALEKRATAELDGLAAFEIPPEVALRLVRVALAASRVIWAQDIGDDAEYGFALYDLRYAIENLDNDEVDRPDTRRPDAICPTCGASAELVNGKYEAHQKSPFISRIYELGQ